MNEIIRSFVNHLGVITNNKFLDKFQFTVPELASIVGNFIYEKTSQNISFRWHLFFSEDSFERGGVMADEKEYRVESGEFSNYRGNNQIVFNSLENKALEIFRKSILGETSVEVSLPVDSLVVHSIEVSPSNAFLRFVFVDPDGNKTVFKRTGADYYAIVTANIALVGEIVELAKERSKTIDNFFNLN